MQTKKQPGSVDPGPTTPSSAWVDPDDAPRLTKEMLEDAEYFVGNTFIKRGPGRPKSVATKEQITVRLDPDVVAKLRESGPGWQTRVNEILRKAVL